MRRAEGGFESKHAEILDGLETAGRASRAIKELRLLSRKPSEREKQRVALAEGIHLARECLEKPGRIRLALASPRLLRSEEGRELGGMLARGECPAKRVDDRLLASLSDVDSHQGILLVVERPEWDLADLVPAEGPARILVACQVQDPGNLGALARVAEAAWCSGLVCVDPGADPWGTRSLRASAGSILRLPLRRFPGVEEAATRLRSLGLLLVGTSPRAREGYREADLRGSLALFAGSEGGGLSPEAGNLMDRLVRVPIRESVESLNVAVAAAVVLFEIAARGDDVTGLKPPRDPDS